MDNKQNFTEGSIFGKIIYFILAVLLTVVLIVFAEPIAVLMQAPEEAMETTVQYIRVCLFLQH